MVDIVIATTTMVECFHSINSLKLNLLHIDLHPPFFQRGQGGGAFFEKGEMFAFNTIADDGGGFVEPPKVRKEFPETWIWEDLNKEGFV